jgi:uncharacterized 2Fe-2S/4Fe-4S cluster protein (DUF4445 family)
MTHTALDIPQHYKIVPHNGTTCSLLDALVKENASIYSPCGGKGICGKCKVQTDGDVSEISSEEIRLLTPEEIGKGIRLACRTYATGSARVSITGDNFTNNSKNKITTYREYATNSNITKCRITAETPDLKNDFSLTECIKKKAGNINMDLSLIRELSNRSLPDNEITLSLCGNDLIDIEFENTMDQKFGAAFDIGTTTIACYLMDLNTGRQIHVASCQNPQSAYGADVISRINYSLQNKNGIKVLSKTVKAGISDLLSKACAAVKIKETHVYECVLVGNTTMNHIFWELNPISLSRVPFTPVTKEMIVADAGTAGISGMNTRGKVVFLPCIGGFVGSDTVGAVIASDLKQKKGNTLIIDLGTNGEIVLATSQQMYACSAAAGPAFEGASIKHGMQAFKGAINSVSIDDDLHYTTIDNKPARGICGSGLIDIVGQFLTIGIIDKTGKIVESETLENDRLSQRIIKENRRKRVILAHPHESYNGEEIYISQKDIRELQLAKGAIRAGINILLKIAKVNFADIDRIFLAGAFGNFINKESARKIGVFPDIPLDRVISMGNAAGEGAKMALCDKEILQKDIMTDAVSIQHITVSNHQDFQDEFVRGMSF